MRGSRSTSEAEVTSRGAAARAVVYGGLAGASDLLPPRLRYGHARTFAARFLRMPVPAIEREPSHTAPAAAPAAGAAGPTVAVVCPQLDVGGIGAVVELLLPPMRAAGVQPVVVTAGEGVRASRLRAAGFDVRAVADHAAATAAIAASGASAVQLHYVSPPHLETAAFAGGLPVVGVLHNMEIHYGRRRWRAVRAQAERAHALVAVSGTVREFHARRVSRRAAERMAVIPNGVPRQKDTGARGDRARARARLGAAIGRRLGGDVVFVTLARYDAQKNIAGTVASFLAAADTIPGVRLVVSGDPSDWIEYRRALALRDAHPAGGRVHLLGDSDAAVLLAAADAFLLDSFFEGWPVATTEALAAGLPLILADAGGAAELQAQSTAPAIVVPNAAGDPAAIDDAAVRRARRRSRRQANRDEIAAALADVAAWVRAARDAGAPAHRTQGQGPIGGAEEMGAAHAELLKDACDAAAAPAPSPRR